MKKPNTPYCFEVYFRDFSNYDHYGHWACEDYYEFANANDELLNEIIQENFNGVEHNSSDYCDIADDICSDIFQLGWQDIEEGKFWYVVPHQFRHLMKKGA